MLRLVSDSLELYFESGVVQELTALIAHLVTPTEDNALDGFKLGRASIRLVAVKDDSWPIIGRQGAAAMSLDRLAAGQGATTLLAADDQSARGLRVKAAPKQKPANNDDALGSRLADKRLVVRVRRPGVNSAIIHRNRVKDARGGGARGVVVVSLVEQLRISLSPRPRDRRFAGRVT